MTVPEREEIPATRRWDLETPITGTDWETAFADAEQLLAEMETVEDPAADGSRLLDVLRRYEDLMRTVEAVVLEAKRHYRVDTVDGDARERVSRARSLAARANSIDSRIREAVQSRGRARVDRYVEEVPGLERYEHYLDDVLRRAPREASDGVGELVTELGPLFEAPRDVYETLTTSDLSAVAVETDDGKRVTVTGDNFVSLLQRPSRTFRERAYRSLCGSLFEVRNTVAATYRHRLVAERKRATLRGYDTTREYALDAENVPTSVHRTVLDAVRANVDPLHRHLELIRTRVEGDDLRMWDTFVPLRSEASPTVEYDDAVDHVLAAVEPLGEEYRSRLAAGLEENWVDAYPHRGKYPHDRTLMPHDGRPHVLVNFRGDVDSLYALAHELGHAVHAAYATESQPYVYSSPSDLVGEAVALLHEALLSHHLVAAAPSPDLRDAAFDRHLRLFHDTFYRYAMLTAFEQAAFDRLAGGGELTTDWLGEQYETLLAEFYAPVERDEYAGDGWMRKPHLYSPYTTYEYCVGFVAGVGLAVKLDEGADGAADRVLGLLRAGASDYPMQLLADAGVDCTTAAPIEAAVDRYEEVLDRAEDVVRSRR